MATVELSHLRTEWAWKMRSKNFDSVNGFTAALRDGETIDFRPVRQEDGEILQNGMSALSPHSRYLRFFSPIDKLSDAQLHYFTEVDQQNHVAWIALAHDRDGRPGVGIARFIRFRDQPDIAEFAVTVIDSYQRRGLGGMLMAVLYLMANLIGIRTLRGFVLGENEVMIHWLDRLGAESEFENGVFRMDIAVDGDLSRSPTHPLLRYFVDGLERMKTLAHHTPD